MNVIKIVFIIYVLALPIIYKLMDNSYEKNRNSQPKNVVGYLKYDYYLILLIHILVVLVIIMILFFESNKETKKQGIILFSVCDFLLEYFFFYLVSWKILLKEDKFIICRFLRRKKEYNYSETKIFITNHHKTVLYDSTEKKIISIPHMVHNESILLKKIEKNNKNMFVSSRKW